VHLAVSFQRFLRDIPQFA